MLILGVVLALTGLIIVAGILFALRSLVLDEAKADKRLHAPGMHTLDYEVPNGVDPAALRAALARAHFTAVTREEGGAEHLTIGCDETDRSHVRAVLEHVNAASGAGPAVMAGRVRFSDET